MLKKMIFMYFISVSFLKASFFFRNEFSEEKINKQFISAEEKTMFCQADKAKYPVNVLYNKDTQGKTMVTEFPFYDIGNKKDASLVALQNFFMEKIVFFVDRPNERGRKPAYGNKFFTKGFLGIAVKENINVVASNEIYYSSISRSVNNNDDELLTLFDKIILTLKNKLNKNIFHCFLLQEIFMDFISAILINNRNHGEKLSKTEDLAIKKTATLIDNDEVLATMRLCSRFLETIEDNNVLDFFGTFHAFRRRLHLPDELFSYRYNWKGDLQDAQSVLLYCFYKTVNNICKAMDEDFIDIITNPREIMRVLLIFRNLNYESSEKWMLNKYKGFFDCYFFSDISRSRSPIQKFSYQESILYHMRNDQNLYTIYHLNSDQQSWYLKQFSKPVLSIVKANILAHNTGDFNIKMLVGGSSTLYGYWRFMYTMITSLLVKEYDGE